MEVTMNWTAILSGVATVALLGSIGCREERPRTRAASPTTSVEGTTVEHCRQRIPEIVERIRPSVVTIVPSGRDATPRIERRAGEQERSRASNGPETRPLGDRSGLGAGIVVDRDGRIVTNHHVVEDVERPRVRFADGRRASVRVVETAPAVDLALLRLNERIEGLDPLEFADSSDLRLGETVVAIGSPFGLTGSVSRGIVSGLGRTDFDIARYEDFIQTDAAVNPGSSGGPLVTLEGEVVGVNTAIMSRSSGHQGVGFAIPSDMASRVVEAMRHRSASDHGWLGISAQRLDAELADVFELDEWERGVLVAGVSTPSPAHRAGLRQGDVVLAFDGEDIERASELRHRVAFAEPGSHHELTIRPRGGGQRRVRVSLGELHRPGSPADIETESILNGLFVATLSKPLRRVFDVVDSVDRGVAVLGVEPGSLPDRAGVEAGDVIIELDHRPVHSLSQLETRLDSARKHVLLLVEQGDGAKYVLAKR
jgi:serine protease Do